MNYPSLPKHTNRQPGKFITTPLTQALTLASRPQRRPPSRTTANDGTTLTTQPVIVDPKRGRRLSRPEEIAIQDRDAPRSKSNYRQSPDVSRRSIVLPPDNYIPVLNPDATITLPPPHEMTVPVPPEAPTSFAPRASGTQTPLNRPRSRSGPITSRSGEPPSYSPGDIQAPIPRRAASPIRDGPSNSVTKIASEVSKGCLPFSKFVTNIVTLVHGTTFTEHLSQSSTSSHKRNSHADSARKPLLTR